VHPQGIPHGPHPGTVEKSLGARETSELAVMCDTFRPMFPTKAAMAFDDLAYPKSWEGEHFPVSLEQHHADGAHRRNGKAGSNGKAHRNGKATKAKAPNGGKAKAAGRKAANIGSTWQ
jgi:homogentisate 1,2-dioxygenase